MLPFDVELLPGESASRQVVYAATKAIVAGDLRPGMAFPSVRELSQALKINPNTAQKIVAELTRDGLLEVRPGIGTVVADRRPGRDEERERLLDGDVERLVVEARRIGLTKADVTRAVAAAWDALFRPDGRSRR